MSDNTIIDPEKIAIVNFKLLSSQIDIPATVQANSIEDFNLKNELDLALNLENQLIRANFIISIITQSAETKQEAKATFHLSYIFKIQNIKDFIDDNNVINRTLTNVIAGIGFSTSRGILMERLANTVFNKFILPIIDPNQLNTNTNP
jgi:hypothetical protein